MSERQAEADVRECCFNVAEVPKADVNELVEAP